MSADLLKLRARDAEDVDVVSAVLQDSIVPLCDMAFQPEEKGFLLVAQRLRRENPNAVERICCAVRIHSVTAVQTHDIDFNQTDRMLDLLALLFDADALTLVFASGAKIRLTLSGCCLTMEDFGEAWPALCQPQHERG